jgi:hypothetical protein
MKELQHFWKNECRSLKGVEKRGDYISAVPIKRLTKRIVLKTNR